MHYLIWQIEDHAPLGNQITQAAESFYTRTGSRATTLVVHALDRERFTALGPLAQDLTESSARTGTVNPGMFWMGIGV